MLKSAWVRSLLRLRVHFGHSNIVLHCLSVFGMLFTEQSLATSFETRPRTGPVPKVPNHTNHLWDSGGLESHR